MEYTSKLDNNISRARVKRISKSTSAEKEAFYLLLDLLNCVRLGITYWDQLSDVQKIQLQYFLDFGNRYVSRSVHYRLEGEDSRRRGRGGIYMSFDTVIIDYDQELALLYRDRIHSDPIFDDGSFIHGHNCKCCTICYDDPSKYEKKEKTSERRKAVRVLVTVGALGASKI
jgi:hypothetical protein